MKFLVRIGIDPSFHVCGGPRTLWAPDPFYSSLQSIETV